MGNNYYTARLYCELNHWKWPWFVPLKPKNWDLLDSRVKRNNKIYRFLFYILGEIVPRKEQLRVHHTEGGLGERTRTDEEFEAWWKRDAMLSNGIINSINKSKEIIYR